MVRKLEIVPEYKSPVDHARGRAIEALTAVPDPRELSDTQLDEHIGMLQDLADDIEALQGIANREAMMREGWIKAVGRAGMPLAIAELEDPESAARYGLDVPSPLAPSTDKDQ